MTRDADHRLPKLPLIALCIVLAIASIPLWEQAPKWASVLIVICAGLRVVIAWRRWPLPPQGLRLALTTLGVGAVLWKSHTVFQIEAGFAIIVVLISLKMLETRTERDFQVLILLGFFLALCSLFLVQDLSRWVYVAGVIVALSTASVHLRMGGFRRSLTPAFRVTATMLLQALPFIAILFLFAPRPSYDLRFLTNSAGQVQAGMTDRMEPGSVAVMASQTGRAFRAAFPGTEQFPPPPYYWRGLVLWAGDGLNWTVGPRLKLERRGSTQRGLRVRQHITLEPHGARWLFALDRPVSALKEASYDPGGVLRADQAVNSLRMYEVTSYLGPIDESLPPEQLEAALMLPARISPEVRALADSFRSGARDHSEIVQHALAFFRNGRFTYSYVPGTYASNELDEFLFKRRSGFCEHYAGAFATLMRAAGVPARVVMGYLGGEQSRYGRYLIVNQSDAHAWCEVWLPGRGWTRQDPTSAATPDGINVGLFNYLAGQQQTESGGGNNPLNNWYGNDALREIRLLWDGLAYQWDLRVLSFNRETQADFLGQLGLGLWRAGQLLSAVVAACAILLATLAWWLRRPGEIKGDRAQRLFARFCRQLARTGLMRPASEPPLTFTRRAASRFPQHAAEIQEIGELYSSYRYGKSPPALAQLARAVGSFARQDLAKAARAALPKKDARE